MCMRKITSQQERVQVFPNSDRRADQSQTEITSKQSPPYKNPKMKIPLNCLTASNKIFVGNSLQIIRPNNTHNTPKLMTGHHNLVQPTNRIHHYRISTTSKPKSENKDNKCKNESDKKCYTKR